MPEHAVRLTITVTHPDDGPDTIREADLALPVEANLADMLPEILALTGAPPSLKPWRIHTASGQRVDPSVPLAHTPATQGGRLIISPHLSFSKPVIRDPAVALARGQRAPARTGLAAAGFAAGAVALTGLIFTGTLPPGAGLPALLVAITIGVLVNRRTKITAGPPIAFKPSAVDGASGALITVLATVAVTAAVTFSITGLSMDLLTHPSKNLGICLAVSACAGAAAAAITGWLVKAPAGFVPALVTACVCLAVAGGVGMTVDKSWAAAGAAAVATATITVSAAPKLALALAHIPVPRLAPAGEPISSATTPVDQDIPRHAVGLLSGMTAGAAAAIVPGIAAAVAGSSSRTAAVILPLAVAGGAILHAVRLTQKVSMWALWIAAHTGTVTAVWAAAAGGHPNTPGLVLALVLLGTAFSAPLWLPALDRVAPPVMSKLEKLEILSLAAILPSALAIMGVFTMVRGL